jgi:predicted nucleotidyltransferase
MLSRDDTINIVKDFITDCKTNNITFRNVVLFGSSVKNTRTDYSDIDLLLVSDQFGYDRWRNAGLIASINKKYNLIEAHTYPTTYFLEGDPFIEEVLNTGISIY